MEEDIFFVIKNDALNNENAATILKKIKNFAVENYKKTFERGEITQIVLNTMLTEIEKENPKRMFFDTTNNLLKIQIQKYLKIDDCFEIKLKL